MLIRQYDHCPTGILGSTLGARSSKRGQLADTHVVFRSRAKLTDAVLRSVQQPEIVFRLFLPADEALEPDERTKVEIVVKDADVKRVVAAIAEHARLGGPGDGKIFVMECADAVQVRTGKHGEQIL